MKTIKLGKSQYSVDYLQSVTEKEAIANFPNMRKEQVTNAWKQANKKTVRNKPETKPENT